jgi:hypothetical protein
MGNFMKALLASTALLVSTQSVAAVYTTLNKPAEPSNYKIKKAITALKKATKNESKSYNLKTARKLIAVTTKKEKYNAAVYINGNKQFNDLGDEVMSWNFSGYCYKGDVEAAVKLINDALELGYWESDEEWIEKATLNGSTIDLLLMDGPNEYEWTVNFGSCSK